MRRPLSVTIITLNEEENIGPCLESVAWAEEIVVCDSGSTDKTLELSRQYTDRVFVDEWRGFSGHKNLALARATHPWVLSLDADERVTPELRREIEGILEQDGPEDGYFVPRRNFFLGRQIRYCGWSPDETLRLFRREKGHFQERAVHEAVELTGRVGHLRTPIEHCSYRSLSDFLHRMDRYSSLAAEEMSRAGRRARVGDYALRPPATFLKMYVFQRGFLEGWRGFFLASLYAAYTFVKYAKLWERQRQRL